MPAAFSTSANDVEVVRLVAVAGDGGGLRRLFEQRAQAFVGLEVAGLDDQVAGDGWSIRAAAQRRALMRRPAVARTTLRPPNIGIVCSSTARRSGIVVEVGVVEADDFAGYLRAPPVRGELRRALGDQAGVGAEEQHRRQARVRGFEERIGLMGLDGNHEWLRPRGEVGREARLQFLADHLGSTILGVLLGADVE